jgi:hypothetical protein
MDDKADLIGNYKRVHSAPCKLESLAERAH